MKDKAELRSFYLDQRRNLSQDKIESASLLIAAQFRDFINSRPVENVHVFLPIKKHNEINTWPIIDHLQKKGIQMILSRTDLSNTTMSHFLWDQQTIIAENKWGIPEPQNGKRVSPDSISMVLVPLIIFDKTGHRVGYGKGFYDDFLRKCAEDAPKVGLSIFEPVDEVEHDPHDIRLDYCITPNNSFSFR